MQVGAHKRLYQGFGDANTRAVELVVAPLVFALLGMLLDSRFGTGHVLAIALGVFGLVGAVLRAYYQYTAAMKQAEAGKPWTR